jgi:hypothetical protein
LLELKFETKLLQLKNDFLNQRKCPFSSLFIPSSFCTRSQSNSNGSVKKEEMATNKNAKARAQKSELEVEMFLLRKFNFSVFQFYFQNVTPLRLSFLHRRPPGLASCAGGQDFFPSYSATEIKPE